MFFRRKKKKLKKVIANFNSYNGEKFTKEIVIPNGWHFVLEFAQYPYLTDENNSVKKVFDWKAGYEVIYDFVY